MSETPAIYVTCDKHAEPFPDLCSRCRDCLAINVCQLDALAADGVQVVAVDSWLRPSVPH